MTLPLGRVAATRTMMGMGPHHGPGTRRRPICPGTTLYTVYTTGLQAGSSAKSAELSGSPVASYAKVHFSEKSALFGEKC